MEYSIRKNLGNIDFQEAKEKVISALKQNGFGVLTEIDVKQTLKKKIDQEFTDYIILGACNPHCAYRALKHEIEIGLLLPCNVVVYRDENSEIIVSAINPPVAMGFVENNEIAPVAKHVEELLQEVINQL